MSVESILKSNEFLDLALQLAETGRFLAERGWSPATSSNYSARLAADFIAISRSGVDKFKMTAEDVMVIAPAADDIAVVAPREARPSAETLIHTAIYRARPQARAVLHTHSPYNTRLSLRFCEQGHLLFKGYELQKAFDGEYSHENVVRVPILSNSQDMVAFARQVVQLLASNPVISGFLIAGHGLYTWAPTLAIARRHAEAFEFLFECHALELAGV